MPNPESPDHKSSSGASDAQTPAAPAHAAPEAAPKSPPAARPAARGSGGRKLTRIIGPLVAVIVIITGYVSLLKYFDDEADSRSTAVEVGKVDGERGLEVTAWLVSVDQQQEQAVIRINFEPKGDITNDEGSLTAPVRLYLNSANGAQDRTFDKGKIMNPTDMTVDLYDSSITRYPFDKFKADLIMSATADVPKPADAASADDAAADGEQAKATGPKTEAKETVEVPVAINFFGGLHGLKVKAGEASSEDGVTEIAFQVSRSNTTLAIAWFIMIVLLAVGATVLTITLSIVFWGKKLELPIIGLLGALMFGFVAFRNTMPVTPPVGSYSDYVAFFWAEGIVASCLFALVATYLKRTLRTKE